MVTSKNSIFKNLVATLRAGSSFKVANTESIRHFSFLPSLGLTQIFLTKAIFRGDLMMLRWISLLCLLSLLLACGADDSFETCEKGSVANLRKLSSEVAESSFCRTIYGEVSFQFTGRCARMGCFFLYDVDADGNRVLGDSIYLSDASALPGKWRDTAKVRLAQVTGDYYPGKRFDDCPSLADQECQRAFYVRDVE